MSESEETSEGTSESHTFGFTWGEVDDLIWMRNDEGDYKRITPDVLEQLQALGRGERDLAELDGGYRDIVEQLDDEGYLVEDAPIVEQPTPDGIRLGPRIALFAVAFVTLGAVTFLRWDMAWPPPRDPWINLWVLPFFIVSAFVHELGHYAAAKPYFDPEIRLGLLNNIFPALVTETTGAWRCPRSIRIWISMAGPLVDIFITLGLAALHLLAFPDMHVLASLVLVQFFRILFVFNPLLEGDGYWILSDALDVVNLRTRGWEDLKAMRPTGFAAYAVLSGIFLIFAVSMSGYVMLRWFVL